MREPISSILFDLNEVANSHGCTIEGGFICEGESYIFKVDGDRDKIMLAGPTGLKLEVVPEAKIPQTQVFIPDKSQEAVSGHSESEKCPIMEHPCRDITVYVEHGAASFEPFGCECGFTEFIPVEIPRYSYPVRVCKRCSTHWRQRIKLLRDEAEPLSSNDKPIDFSKDPFFKFAIGEPMEIISKENPHLEIRLDGNTWSVLTGIEVIDPDGWDRRNWEESWAKKITLQEFIRRCCQSTLGGSGIARLMHIEELIPKPEEKGPEIPFSDETKIPGWKQPSMLPWKFQKKTPQYEPFECWCGSKGFIQGDRQRECTGCHRTQYEKTHYR